MHMAMAWIWTGMAVVSLIFAAWNGTMDAVGAAAGIFQFLLALLDQLVTLLLGAFQGMLSLIAGLFGVTLSNLQLQL